MPLQIWDKVFFDNSPLFTFLSGHEKRFHSESDEKILGRMVTVCKEWNAQTGLQKESQKAKERFSWHGFSDTVTQALIVNRVDFYALPILKLYSPPYELFPDVEKLSTKLLQPMGRFRDMNHCPGLLVKVRTEFARFKDYDLTPWKQKKAYASSVEEIEEGIAHHRSIELTLIVFKRPTPPYQGKWTCQWENNSKTMELLYKIRHTYVNARIETLRYTPSPFNECREMVPEAFSALCDGTDPDFQIPNPILRIEEVHNLQLTEPQDPREAPQGPNKKNKKNAFDCKCTIS